MPRPADDLADTVRAARARLLALDERAAAEPRAPGKWSRKQVLGHLIDSASNHHQRFVRAQERDGLAHPGYAQDAWVVGQDYQGERWADLVTLWHAYNLHLAHVLGRVPEAALAHTVTIGGGEPVTLGFLAVDYVRHLKHHLGQILG